MVYADYFPACTPYLRFLLRAITAIAPPIATANAATAPAAAIAAPVLLRFEVVTLPDECRAGALFATFFALLAFCFTESESDLFSLDS